MRRHIPTTELARPAGILPPYRPRISCRRRLDIFLKQAQRRPSIVGMYIGNGRMIHASSSRGVVEDNLYSQYFVTYYHGAGRVPQLAKANPVPTKETQTRTNPSSEAAGGNSSAARTPEKQRTNSQPKPECDKGSKVQQPGTQTSEHKPTQTMPAQNVRPQTAHQDTTATTCPETIVRNAFSKTKKK